MFPENVIDTLADRIITIPGVTGVEKRSLNYTDANGACGITVDEWQPDEYEMGTQFFLEPTLATYTFMVQHLVKHTTQTLGEKAHREVARSLRLMLVRDQDTQVALRSLVDSTDRTERIQRWAVSGQRFGSNQIEGSFVYLSQTEFVVQTETT